MREIRLDEKDYSFVFSPYARPVATVAPGETVALYTEDAFIGRLYSATQNPTEIAKFNNPQIGPLYVTGAEPNDTLKIEIINIERTRDWAVSCFKEYFGGLVGTPTTRMLNAPLPQPIFIYKYVDGMFRYNDKLSFPWEPFLGTIATAPEIEAFSSLTPFAQGGNMDVPDVKVGNTIYLPVSVPGAYFYTGDCHAKQGQGEVCGVAMEISARVTLKFDLIKQKAIKWPRIESRDELMCVGSARPMEDAARIAYSELLGWLEEIGWGRDEAYQAITQAGKLYVGNMVDTVYSLVAKIDKEIAYRK
jgi:acetamidase/formamidase